MENRKRLHKLISQLIPSASLHKTNVTLRPNSGDSDHLKKLFGDSHEKLLKEVIKLYNTVIKPLEEYYKFPLFHSPLLNAGDFEGKPLVVVIGPSGTGKTTFLEYLTGTKYPGQRIGPDPTTDKFVIVTQGSVEAITLGPALTAQTDGEFTQLSRFGQHFLDHLNAAHTTQSDLLNYMTLVDTPGMLIGGELRNRNYDFGDCAKWFIERADMVLLLFDVNKVEISDEFKQVMELLRGQQGKVKIVLNKADCVRQEDLVRVSGALMYNLGHTFRHIRGPEVPRLFIGSFWAAEYKSNISAEAADFFEREKNELIHDIKTLPLQSPKTKLNDFVKRLRELKVHMVIMGDLRDQLPWFGKRDRLNEIAENLEDEFKAMSEKYDIVLSDFPDPEVYTRRFLRENDSPSLLMRLKPGDMDKLEKVMNKVGRFASQLTTLDEGSMEDYRRHHLNVPRSSLSASTIPVSTTTPTIEDEDQE